MLNTSYAPNPQAPDLVPTRAVETLTDNDLRIFNPDGEATFTVAEACEFERRLDKRLTFNELRQEICLDYDFGFVTAENTLQRLWDNGLIRSADDLAFLVAAGVRALSEGGR
jgi:hypothetical protein